MAKNTNKKSVVVINNEEQQKGNRSGYDLVAKILSVVAAVALWFYVIDAQTTQLEKPFYGIEVELTGFDYNRGLDIISGRDGTVDVTLRGSRAQINALESSDISASVDMSDVSDTGNYRLNVSVSAPSGVTVVEKSIGFIEVTVDKTIGKSVPVDLSMTYTLPDTYEFGEISVTPKNAYIWGPADLVEKISKAKAMLDLGDVSGNRKSVCSIVLVDENGNVVESPYIKCDTSSVDVTVPVLKSAQKDIKLNIADTHLSFKCRVVPESVTVKGDANVVDDIEMVSTAVLNIEKNGVSTVRLSLPDGVIAYDKNNNVVSEVTAYVTSVFDPTYVPETNDDEVGNE